MHAYLCQLWVCMSDVILQQWKKIMIAALLLWELLIQTFLKLNRMQSPFEFLSLSFLVTAGQPVSVPRVTEPGLKMSSVQTNWFHVVMSILFVYLSQLRLCGEVGKPAEPVEDQRIDLLQAASINTRYICNAAEINHSLHIVWVCLCAVLRFPA